MVPPLWRSPSCELKKKKKEIDVSATRIFGNEVYEKWLLFWHLPPKVPRGQYFPPNFNG